MKKLLLSACFLIVISMTTASAATLQTIDFEAFTDSETLSNQIAGLTFTNATALTDTGSLNASEFPPRSGGAVLFDNGAPIQIVFSPMGLNASAILRVAAYATYVSQLTLTAYGPGDMFLSTSSSAFAENTTQSGNAQNEFIEVSGADIRKVVFSALPAGDSFVLDDLSFEFEPLSNSSVIPEPGFYPACLLALAGMGYRLRRRQR
jgi:hypothetical protein